MRYVFLHGNGGGSGSDHWYPTVAASLRAAGHEALTPDLPDAELARASYWLPYLRDELGADENTVLIGHSSGAIAAMRHAQEHRIAASVLVGTYHTDLGMDDEKRSGYFDSPWLWPRIRGNQQWVTVFAGPDDPWVPVAEARHVAEQLQADYVEMPGRGHFLQRDFPELTHWLLARAA